MSFSAHRDTLGTGGYSLMLSFTHINVYSILFRSSLFKRSAACISDNFFKKKTHQKYLLFYNESIKCISISKCLYFCTYTQINHLQSKNKMFFLVVSLEVLFWLAVSRTTKLITVRTTSNHPHTTWYPACPPRTVGSPPYTCLGGPGGGPCCTDTRIWRWPWSRDPQTWRCPPRPWSPCPSVRYPRCPTESPGVINVKSPRLYISCIQFFICQKCSIT